MPLKPKKSKVEAYVPDAAVNGKFPIVPQVATNGGFASGVMHDRFQVIEASMFMKQMRRWSGSKPVDVYYILDHDSYDGILCTEDVPQVFAHPAVAMLTLEGLKDRKPLIWTMPDGTAAPTFRQWSQGRGGLLGESLQVIIGGRRPMEMSPLQVAYDNLCLGFDTPEVVNRIKIKYPTASMGAMFIDWYRGALLDYGYALPASARERMQVSEVSTDSGGAPAPVTEVAALKPSRKSRPNPAPVKVAYKPAPAKKAAKAPPAKPVKAAPEPKKVAAKAAAVKAPVKAAKLVKATKAPTVDALVKKASTVVKANLDKVIKAKLDKATKPAKTSPKLKMELSVKAAKTPAAKPAKVETAKDVPFASGRSGSVSSFFKEKIMLGTLTEQQIFAAARKQFGHLTDDHFYYVQWNRNDLKRKGFNPPEPRGTVYKRGKPPKAK